MNAVAAMPAPRSGERLTLADGADVDIRPLERSDRAALASALARLIERARDEGHLALRALAVAPRAPLAARGEDQ